jgi:hypothetical protein
MWDLTHLWSKCLNIWLVREQTYESRGFDVNPIRAEWEIRISSQSSCLLSWMILILVSASEIVVQCNNYYLTRRELCSMRPWIWLDDNVLSTFLAHRYYILYCIDQWLYITPWLHLISTPSNMQMEALFRRTNTNTNRKNICHVKLMSSSRNCRLQ